jgi:hypothetical protein
MADQPLFILDADGRWRLAYDRQQWIIQRRVGAARPSDSGAVLKSGWQAVSFVGGKKTTLARLFREKGIVLTLEAQSRLDALPEQFMDFIAAPETFAVQWAEAA